jgi:hypothetical protein
MVPVVRGFSGVRSGIPPVSFQKVSRTHRWRSRIAAGVFEFRDFRIAPRVCLLRQAAKVVRKAARIVAVTGAGEGGRGSECYNDSTVEDVCAEAETVGRFSLKYPNIVGGFFDDMKGLMERRGHGVEQCAAIRTALKKHNPSLQLECVVYSHELDAAERRRFLNIIIQESERLTRLINQVLDLAKFIIMNLNNGAYKEKRLLKEETIKEMQRLQAPTGKSNSGMGLTWFRTTHDDRVMLYHTGASPTTQITSASTRMRD